MRCASALPFFPSKVRVATAAGPGNIDAKGGFNSIPSARWVRSRLDNTMARRRTTTYIGELGKLIIDNVYTGRLNGTGGTGGAFVDWAFIYEFRCITTQIALYTISGAVIRSRGKSLAGARPPPRAPRDITLNAEGGPTTRITAVAAADF